MQGERGSFPPQEVINPAECQIRIFPTIRLKDLGIMPDVDRLGLASQEFRLVYATTGSGDKYFAGLLLHPFREGHLTDFINTVTPGHPTGVPGAVGDWELPKIARGEGFKKGSNRNYPRLHAIHQEDSYVGPYYQEFVRSHADSWIEQLQDETHNRFFSFLDQAILVGDRNEFGLATHKDLISRCVEFLEGKVSWGRVFDVAEAAGLVYKGGRALTEFLNNLPEFDNTLMERFSNDFWHETPEAQRIKITVMQYVTSFLEQLSWEEQRNIGLVYWLDKALRPLIDLHAQTVLLTGTSFGGERDFPRTSYDISVQFQNTDTVEVENSQRDIGCVLTFGREILPEGFEPSIVHYALPPVFYSNGLHPLLAWKKSASGIRRFLTQSEAIQLLAIDDSSSLIKGDVMLGRVFATSLSQSARASLVEEMELMHGTRPNSMMTSAVATLVSMPVLPEYEGTGKERRVVREHVGPAAFILEDEKGALAKLEEYAARLAA